MPKVNWKTNIINGDKQANMGGLILECNGADRKIPRTCRKGSASLRDAAYRDGPPRKSPEKAMEDAMKLGREIVEEYSVALEKIKEKIGIK